jgi:hypothetical protein
MKINFFILVFCGIIATTYAQSDDGGVVLGPQITFLEETHDFGDITQGDKVEYVFEFENTGNEPLILSNVLTTCGCTATNWPRDPIAPGKKSEMAVQFNSTGKMGRQNKVVTVLSNATNAQTKVRIMTNILPPEKN